MNKVINLSINVEFVSSGSQDALFNWITGDKSEDTNFIFLPDSMRSILRLHILMRVPVGVKNDNRIGGLQI